MNQVTEFFSKLFDVSDWPPRWRCGIWTDFHGWMYIISDLLVWSAYFAIPFFIIKYISKKHDNRFIRLYFLFAGFILACGATHFFDAVTFWYPLYRVNALVRAITGIISWITVIYLYRKLPMAFSLRTSRELEAEVEQRKKAEDKFRNLLESAPDSMVIVNEYGIIQLVNAQTVKMFGYSREEMMNQSVELLMPVEFRKVHQERRRNNFEQNGNGYPGAGVEISGIRKDGQRFPVEISVCPIDTDEGRLLSTAIRDISEKKHLENEIREANFTLERKVKQRTAELESKNKELEQFAYVASHDLQEPLRNISGFVELLRKQYQGKLDDHADKYIGYILQSSDRMKTLIKDLLDYSRIGREKVTSVVNSQVVVEEVLADLNTTIRENNAQVTCGSLPLLMQAYPTELKLLFQNLISNAIKFRKPGEAPRITITAEKQEMNWRFMVQDQGIGIEEQYRERIFEIFQRLHNRSLYDGSGIGLAHCKKIVELHGGSIWVDSEPGKGSTFNFTIAENLPA